MSARKPKPAGYDKMKKANPLGSIAPLPTLKEWNQMQKNNERIIVVKIPGEMLQDANGSLGVQALTQWAKAIETICAEGHKLLIVIGANNILDPNDLYQRANLVNEPEVREAFAGAERHASSANARTLAGVLRGNKIACKIFDGSESEDLATLLNDLIEQWVDPHVVILAGAGNRGQEWAVEGTNLLDQHEVFLFNNQAQSNETITVSNLLRQQGHGNISYEALEQALFDEIKIRLLSDKSPTLLLQAINDPRLGITILPE